MALDRTIKSAIEHAVNESNQSAQLSKKILAWLELVAGGSEDLHDREAAQRHLEVLFDSVVVETKDAD